MARMLDTTDISAAVAASKARCAHHLNEDTEEGAISRFTHQVTEAMTVWRSLELNRGTNPAHVAHAMLRAFEAAIAGHLSQHVEPDLYQVAVMGIAQEMALDLMRVLTASPDEMAKFGMSIHPKDVGTA